MCNASHFPEIVLLRVFFTAWKLEISNVDPKTLAHITNSYICARTCKNMAKNYIYVFVTVKTKAITCLHYFLLLKDVMMTKTKQI